MRAAIAYPNYDKVLSEKTQTELRIRAYQNSAFETCGFVLESGDIVDVPNISEEPKTSFFMSPVGQFNFMKLHKNHILGVWHTHVNHCPWPSKEDEFGVLCGMPSDYYYWIVTMENVYQFEWEIKDGVSALQS
jgi:proteasome lid subunit RPN8/RPN11